MFSIIWMILAVITLWDFDHTLAVWGLVILVVKFLLALIASGSE